MSAVSLMEFLSKFAIRRSTVSLWESFNPTLASVVIGCSGSIFSVSDNMQGSRVSEPMEEDLAWVVTELASGDMEVALVGMEVA